MNPLQQHYEFDPRARIWHRPDAAAFRYADGAEEELLKILRKVHDRSVLSPQLISHWRNWPLLYHLSGSRTNLLRPFADTLLRGSSVLELGCGCGAITRFLGETAARLVAVEGSPARAMVAAERCRDLANVLVLADQIQMLPGMLGNFDVVTLIGVLEYAGSYGLNAVDLLEKARSFLKPDGVLILALENRFGLKYLAGVPEDHLGSSFSGVTGGYAAQGVRTWSRRQLVDMLGQAGFAWSDQFVPLPDYKLPTTVLSPAALAGDQPDLRLGQLFLRGQRLHEAQPVFNLPGAWQGVVEAGLLPDLADSLFLLAGMKKRPVCDEDVLVWHYGNITHAITYYAKSMEIRRSDRGGLEVRRASLAPQSGPRQVEAVLEDEPYYPGRRCDEAMLQTLLRQGWSAADLAGALRPWVELFLSLATPEGLVDGKYLDLTPANLIIEKDGALRPFDLEWRWEKPLPLSFLLARGLFSTLPLCAPVASPAPGTDLAYGALARALFEHYGLVFDEKELQEAWDGDTLDRRLFAGAAAWSLLAEKKLEVMPGRIQETLALARAAGVLAERTKQLEALAASQQKIIAQQEARLKLLQKTLDLLERR